MTPIAVTFINPSTVKAAPRCFGSDVDVPDSIYELPDCNQAKEVARLAGQNINFQDKLCYQVGVGVGEITCPSPSELSNPCNLPNAQDAKAECNQGDFDADCRDGLTKDNCGIVAYLVLFINVLSAIVGIVSVIMITVWGIQYSVSRDNPQMVSSARLHILQTVIAVVSYLFVYAFLQWLIPGGIF